MTDKQATNVGQLRLVDGSRVENPANLGIAEQRSFLPISGRGKGRLYVLVELTGGLFGREEMCQDLVAAIVEEYFHTPGTVTYGLRQAILMANAYLRRSNERVSSEHRLGGVACVVLRGRESFIAQAGWPMVYLIHGDEVEAFPDMTLEDEDSSILGQNQTTEVRLFRSFVQPDDTILMLDGPLALHLDIARIGPIASGSVEQVVNNLQALAPPEDCTAMAIRIGPAPLYAREPAEQWTFTPVEPPPPSEVETPTRAVSTAPVPPPEQLIRDSAPTKAAAGPLETTQAAFMPARPTTSDRVGTFLHTVGDGMRALGERMLPERKPQPSRIQRRRRAARTRRGRDQQVRQTNWGLAAALAIPILVLLFVGGYTTYRNWSHRSQYDTYLETARLKRDIAISSAESPTVARDYWLEVLASLKAADSLQPNQPEVAQMRTQAEAELDRIDGVTRLGQIYRIYEYNVTGSAPGRIVVAGLDVYVLDRGMGRVYRHALNEVRNALRNPSADQLLIQEGQPTEGEDVGVLIDIAWMKEGGERQAGALAILDRNGLLLEYDPTWEQFTQQIVGGKDAWRAPLALRTYDSNLYVLDPMANQVFKYWSQRYTEAPDRWIKQSDADLAAAIDMGIDGNIYLLHSDGKLIKYYGGEPAPFAVTKTPRPLSSAGALYLDTEEVTQYIYVADTSERRIVQLDREGTFVRQLQPALGQEDSFRGLSGLFVDETGGKLYYIAANALYVTDLPPV